MSDPLAEIDETARLEGQRRGLPAPWRQADRVLVRATEMAVCAVGVAFVAMITLEVVSRYLFDFSIAVVNAGARMLLVWFFLLGAGLALRRGAHVGFELLLQSLSGTGRRAVSQASRAVSLAFFALMLWSGVVATMAAIAQTDPGLGISVAWGVAAIPAGFALLVYHLAVLAWADRAGAGAAR